MRKLTLIATTALAALAITTSTAQAETVVLDYPGGNPCDPYCEIDLSGRIGSNYWQCDASVALRINIDGTVVEAGNQTMNGSSCFVQPCDDSQQQILPWTGALTQPPVDGTAAFGLDLCVDSPGSNNDSVVPLTGDLSSGASHGQTHLSATGVSSGGTLGYGQQVWVNLEGSDQVELIDTEG